MNLLDRIMSARQGGAVTRYHTTRLVMPETVGQHTFNVAQLAMILTEGNVSASLFQAILCHDLGEFVTGDIPSPVKKALPSGLSEALVNLEAETIEKIHPNAPMGLKAHEVSLLMLCDNLDGLLKCMDELTMGNGFALAFGDRYCQYVKSFMQDVGDIVYEEAVWEIVDKYIFVRSAYNEPKRTN
jgi:5'-deoxynucleotidase YfbR-like HD superfamily hydrolase